MGVSTLRLFQGEATGLPLIVSDVGGNAEAVIDGRNGIVIPPNDADALARALVAMHDDPFRRRAMGCESRRLVEEQFSIERMWRSHEELYRLLCDRTTRELCLDDKTVTKNVRNCGSHICL